MREGTLTRTIPLMTISDDHNRVLDSLIDLTAQRTLYRLRAHRAEARLDKLLLLLSQAAEPTIGEIKQLLSD